MQSEKNFFEGKDFRGQSFKALMPEFYPLEYKEYINGPINIAIYK